MTDHEFLARFEAADLDDFRHSDHVRVAWIYLERDGRERALEQMLDGIRRFAAAKGAHTKFHYTLTRAWLNLIDLARRQHPDVRSPQALIAACPLLGDSRAVGRFYSADLLESDAARGAWVEPDRAPFAVGHHPSSPVETMPNPNPDPFVQFHEAVTRAAGLGIDTAPTALATADASGRPRYGWCCCAAPTNVASSSTPTTRAGRRATSTTIPAPHCASTGRRSRSRSGSRAPSSACRPTSPMRTSPAVRAAARSAPGRRRRAQILPGRDVLEKQIDEIEKRFDGQPVPRPPFWGGFRISPDRIEFWYGRTSRLHDRVVYVRDRSSWRIERLFP